MSGYYDRLEEQLMRATAGPMPRGRAGRIALWRPRGDVLAAVAALGLVAAVAAIFIGLRHSSVRVERHPAQPALSVVHNRATGPFPPLGGSLSCETTLLPARVGRPWPAPFSCYLTHVSARRPPGAAGTAIIDIKPPSGLVFSLDVAGLAPGPRTGDDAVWLLPGRITNTEACTDRGAYNPPPCAFSLILGARPVFVGIVSPRVGASGRLRAQGLMPPVPGSEATGAYLLAVTRQPHPSNKSVGRVLVAGWVSF